MKQFFLICAVILAAVLVKGSSSSELDSFNLLTEHISGDENLGITDEQIKCIQDGEKTVIEAHQNLKECFDDIAATSKKLTDFADRCRALSGLKQKICFKRLDKVAKREAQRLFGNITEEQKAVIDEIKEVVRDCLKDEPTSVSVNEPEGSLDIFVNSLLDIENTDEQTNCIQDAYKKVYEDFPALKSWFDDIQNTFTKLAENNKKCDQLTGFAKLKCKVKVYVNAQIEGRRLFGNLTEEQKTALEALKDAVLECIQSGNVLNTADEPEFPDLRITEEQIDCIKEGYKNVVGDNPELQEWFSKVQETLTKLAGNAKECKALSGIKQLRCYAKLFTTARDEIKRLLEELSDEQKEILQELRDVIKKCLADNSFF